MDLLDLINPKKNTIAFELTFDDYIRQSRQVVSIYNYILGKSYIQAATTAWTSFLTISKYDVPAHTREQVTRITDFLISSSRAEDPDQFASAIENFALPSGSSSIKRKSIFNLSINTYPGVYLSGERLTGISSNKKDTLWAFNTGVAVPIGLAANWGLKNKDVFTIFASVIDIGAFTSFRFKDNNSALPEIDLKNILAPGIHLSTALRIAHFPSALPFNMVPYPGK